MITTVEKASAPMPARTESDNSAPATLTVGEPALKDQWTHFDADNQSDNVPSIADVPVMSETLLERKGELVVKVIRLSPAIMPNFSGIQC